ncbi:MAG: hypothetical protein GY906_24125 [bacterium]|nr:hypothetical protein [bacterium]
MGEDWQATIWQETVASSFDEHGIAATTDQIAKVADDVRGTQENWELVSYTPTGPSQLQKDLTEANRQLDEERRKTTCRECHGIGHITSYGPCHSATSQCWKCRGEGRHLP